MKTTGKFLNKAAEAYNKDYKKMKTGGSTKKKSMSAAAKNKKGMK